MMCLVWATIWFSNYEDAFDHLKLLNCEQKLSAEIIVNDNSGTLRYCQKAVSQ